MTIDIDEFRKYLRIDKFNLDDELVQKAQLLEEVGDAHVEAMAQADALKEELANIAADIDFDIRKRHRDEKITDKAVDKEIQRHPKHRKASEAYLAAKHRAAKLANLQDAFVKRATALNRLCEIYIAGYFQKNSVQGTSSTDKAAYNLRRSQMAEERAKRQK